VKQAGGTVFLASHQNMQEIMQIRKYKNEIPAHLNPARTACQSPSCRYGVLNFDAFFQFTGFIRQIEAAQRLTNKNDYDIVLYCVSMDQKPLSQPKPRKHRVFRADGLPNLRRLFTFGTCFNEKLSNVFSGLTGWTMGRGVTTKNRGD
jgi:hypothetical protein